MALVAVFLVFWILRITGKFAKFCNFAKSGKITKYDISSKNGNFAKSGKITKYGNSKKNNWEFHNFAILQKTRNLQNSFKKMGISIWPVTQKIGTFANYIILFFPILKFRNFDIFLVPGSINWPQIMIRIHDGIYIYD